MAAILPGTVTVPNDDVLKSYVLRALPQVMKEQMFLSGLNQQSSIQDMLVHLKVADGIYRREHPDKKKKSNANSNSQGDNGAQGSNRDRSRSRSRSRNNRSTRGNNHRGQSNQGSSRNFNTRDFDAPCPLHNGSHTWGQCYDNRYGPNSRVRGGRNGRGDGRGGRGGRGGGSSYRGNGGNSYQGSNNQGNGNQDSHHVDNQSRQVSNSSGQNNAAGTNNNGPPPFVGGAGTDAHAIDNGWGRREARGSGDTAVTSLFSNN